MVSDGCALIGSVHRMAHEALNEGGDGGELFREEGLGT